MKQKILNIIRAHNLMIDAINNANMTCNLFRGMEVWHKVACEGADIVSAARAIGIGAVVNMQSGVIALVGDPVPTIDTPLKHGRWIPVDEKEDAFDCSECDAMVQRRHNFCPKCGAKMDAGGRR